MLFIWYNHNNQFYYMKLYPVKVLLLVAMTTTLLFAFSSATWQSKFLKVNADGSITYFPDEQGNTIPDFSRVGYHHGDKAIPDVKVVKTLTAPTSGDSEKLIQQAIDEVAKLKPNSMGHRGAILLKKGTYKIPGVIKINASGIVLRGEKETVLVASGKLKRNLIVVSGDGDVKEVNGTRVKIADDYVPVGAKSFKVKSAKAYQVGDDIIVYRPATEKWIADLKMDKIVPKSDTRQWDTKSYNFPFERKITKIEGNTIFIDNPIVMAMEAQYGGGEVYKYTFTGRIKEVGIENLEIQSEYANDTDEEHGWIAVQFNKVENAWARNIVSKYFGYSCVSLERGAKKVTVIDSKCLDGKSQITGGRRYSFNNVGQQNIFMNLETTEGRHDYVTAAQVLGPNVFYNCKASKTHSDIGPHHRWTMGTLYDNVVTDGQINVQDRGNSGTGHGWAGVNQVFWNCRAKEVTLQNPYVSGKNYAIGVIAEKRINTKLGDRPDGEWEGQNKEGLQPSSLYIAQLNARKNLK